jgi:hypothetical protein
MVYRELQYSMLTESELTERRTMILKTGVNLLSNTKVPMGTYFEQLGLLDIITNTSLLNLFSQKKIKDS